MPIFYNLTWFHLHTSNKYGWTGISLSFPWLWIRLNTKDSLWLILSFTSYFGLDNKLDYPQLSFLSFCFSQFCQEGVISSELFCSVRSYLTHQQVLVILLTFESKAHMHRCICVMCASVWCTHMYGMLYSCICVCSVCMGMCVCMNMCAYISIHGHLGERAITPCLALFVLTRVMLSLTRGWPPGVTWDYSLCHVFLSKFSRQASVLLLPLSCCSNDFWRKIWFLSSARPRKKWERN